MILETLNSQIMSLCAVCVSDRSGAQIALTIILMSFVVLGLANWSWKKYFKKKLK